MGHAACIPMASRSVTPLIYSDRVLKELAAVFRVLPYTKTRPPQSWGGRIFFALRKLEAFQAMNDID